MNDIKSSITETHARWHKGHIEPFWSKQSYTQLDYALESFNNPQDLMKWKRQGYRGRGKITVSSSRGTIQGTVEVSGRARPASIRVVDGSDLTQLALFIAGSVTIEEVRVNYQSRYSRY